MTFLIFSPFTFAEYFVLKKMQNYPNKTKEMFIVRALEKILSDKDIKRQGQLKKACESAITTLKGWFVLSVRKRFIDFLVCLV